MDAKENLVESKNKWSEGIPFTKEMTKGHIK